ncbi:MAG: sulfatase-like hydrolase/transferase [Bacteroidetes bacterium]|nr:sulfatase-like hydrolase/transferase [Bacteroidota bacterium]
MKYILLFTFVLFMTNRCHAQQNVIVIIADDLGADYCGFTDNATDTAKMPNIRSLLQKGVRFKNAWATPYCSSTRAGTVTGRYSFRTSVGTVIGAANSNDLDSAEMTIASLLKYDAPVKYTTANIGKWHMNVQTPQKLLYPTQNFGYDLFKGNFSGAIASYYNWTKVTNGIQTDTITNYATTETIDDAIAWLDTIQNNKPFFLWLAFNAPHTPFHVPPAGLHTVTGLTGTQQHINQNAPLYFKAMIEAMDTETGRLLQWLITNNKMDSTNFIFMGDNGNDKRVIQIADTTHTKGTLYDYGVHVPFLISGPAVVNPNRSSDALVNVQDVFATSLELAGFSNWTTAIPNGTVIDSKSIVPILKNQNTNIRDWAFTELFTPTPTPKDGKSIRNLDYHLIKFDNGTQQFFNMTIDPTEQTNLLLQNLSAAELSNYNYLCNELSTLTGISSCLSGVSVNDIAHDIETLQIHEEANGLIRFDANTPYTVIVYTAIGTPLFTIQFTAGMHTLPLSAYAKGMYIVEMKTNEQRKIQKIMLE